MKNIVARAGAGAAAGIVATGIVTGVMALTRVAALRRRRVDRATAAAHLGYGAAVGMLCALSPMKVRSAWRGSLAGLATWAVGYAARGRPTSMIVPHLVYGAALGSLLRRLLPRVTPLRGGVAVVCGASRGLGRAIAHELAKQGMRLAICARTAEDLERTRAELAAKGADVMAVTCDLSRENEARSFFARVLEELGEVDVLVLNAATLTVAPIETTKPSDFHDAMRSIFDTALHPTLAVLPSMQARRAGTIVFITSIGGKIGVPHLGPYSAAKFAEVGLAEALRAEVAKDGIRVLTVVPGLMRTGSHLRATFRGAPEKELAWFGASAVAPGASIDADRAARRVVGAIERGESELVYTAPARLAVRTHDLVPSLWSFVMSLAGRLLPRAPRREHVTQEQGSAVAARSSSTLLGVVRSRSADAATRHGQSV